MERLFTKLVLFGFGLVCLVEFFHMHITASLLNTQLTGKETILNLGFFFLFLIFTGVGMKLNLTEENSNDDRKDNEEN